MLPVLQTGIRDQAGLGTITVAVEMVISRLLVPAVSASFGALAAPSHLQIQETCNA